MKTRMLFLILFILGLNSLLLAQDCENGEECNKLGWEYWNKKEFQKAFETLDKACELGNFKGCTTLGHLYQYGVRTQKDEQKAKEYGQKGFELSKKACEENDAEACVGLSGLYYRGLGVQKDKNKAFELLEHICDLGHYKACVANYVAMIEKRGLKKAEEYRKKAFKPTKEACEKDDRTACVWLKSMSLVDNDEYVKNFEELNKLYQKGFELTQKECLKGDYNRACYDLGVCYQYGIGVQKDIQKAKEFFEQACDVDSSSACKDLAILYYKEGNEVKSEEYLKKACDLGSGSRECSKWNFRSKIKKLIIKLLIKNLIL